MSAHFPTADAIATPATPEARPSLGQSGNLTPARRFSPRECRVAVALSVVLLVSSADLYLTLTYLHNGGMAEGNPIARWVMSLGCPWLLALWKICLLGLTCTILFAFRKRASAEIGAWVCCAAMAWLCVQWNTYVQDINREIARNPQLTQVSSWVAFDKN
ncbi:MAG: DUF5658 family protein [Phycisphaerales bacterium]|nr:DUF5658 family protein [Phycisphaerales bacterium]